MSKIAFLYGDVAIYWSSIVLLLAVVCAVLAALAVRLLQNKPIAPVAVLIPLALTLSLLCARLIHWYCRADQYDSLVAALTDFTGGGYSMLGVFAGCLAAALILRVMHVTDDLPSLLDCLAPAACLGISVGRLSVLFNTDGRGKIMVENEAYRRLPIGAPMENVISGEIQWRFATFCFQSIIAAAILVILVVMGVLLHRLAKKHARSAAGDVFCLFLLFYFSSEIVMDSTRYDALFLRSNGFVSLVQIVAAVAVAAVFAWFSVRSVRSCGLRPWHFVLWVVWGCALGCAGYMEYYVQRHSSLYLLSYGVMSSGLLLAAAASITMCITGLCGKKKTAKKDPAEKPEEAPEAPAVQEA